MDIDLSKVDEALKNMSYSTTRLYRKDIINYSNWCKTNNIDPLTYVGLSAQYFIVALQEEGASTTKLARVLGAVCFAHQVHELPSPRKGLVNIPTNGNLVKITRLEIKKRIEELKAFLNI